MTTKLTPNSIAAINSGDLNLKPLVQVLEVTKITGLQERFQIVVSDGSATQHALLATQLSEVARAGKVRRGSVVQLLEYICSTVQNQRMIIILNMEVLIMESDVLRSLNSYPEAESTFPKATLLNHSTFKGDQPPNKDQSYPPTVQPSYKPPSSYRNHGAITKNDAPAHIIPIAALNPYQGRWAIKARVTAKGELRRYNNARGDGKVFSFDLLDSDGGEIRAICFNAIVDRFYDAIEVGNVYIISKCNLKPAQKNYNHLSNDWEIFLESSSIVEICLEEDGSIPAQQFNFKAIIDIENAENNAIVDFIGIVVSINPSVTILRKNGMETLRRIANLKDKSGRSVELTLWGDFCNMEGKKLQELIDSGNFPALAVKSGKVSDFSGKSVGTISASQLFISPVIPEALSLREWFDKEGKDISFISISKESFEKLPHKEIRKCVSQIKEEGLGRGDKPDWVTLKATVSFIKTENLFYTACPLMIGDRQCSKKVSQLINGNWHCEKCDREFAECEYKYLLQAQVQDHTGLTWVTAFQGSADSMLGCSARELFIHKQHNDRKFAEIIRSCLFVEFLFRIKIKEEHNGEGQRIKILVVSAEKVKPDNECRYLLSMISKFSYAAF